MKGRRVARGRRGCNPLRFYSLVLGMRGWALFLCRLISLSFFCLVDWGTGEGGALLELTVVGLGQDKVLYKEPAAVREGSGKPLPWPFGPHVAVYK